MKKQQCLRSIDVDANAGIRMQRLKIEKLNILNVQKVLNVFIIFDPR